MGKIYTIDEITAAVKPIAEKYGIDKVWLFGSYARGEATEKSDVDLLISYQNHWVVFIPIWRTPLTSQLTLFRNEH